MSRPAPRHPTRGGGPVARAAPFPRLALALLAALLLPAAAAAQAPRTRAERTGWRETSRHADVVAFLDSLRAAGAPVHVGSIGVTTEGRAIPYVVASRPRVTSPAEARRLGRPVVYLQGNIHAGEVEGKEALLMLLRDLALGQRPGALDSLVVVAVPIYNADGNERLGPQAVNRAEQNGPAEVGVRPNAQGLDLNRDYVKADAPETRASLAMFRAWDPDLFVDLHTTDGSYHGYSLTYAPPLPPAAGRAAALARDELLPELRRRMRARHGLDTFDYGNFSLRYGADVTADTTRDGWFSYDHRPRFGTNYYGLRGGVALLAEAYSHDPFRRRVEATYAFVREILSLAAERRAGLLALTRAPGGLRPGDPVPVRAELTRAPYTGEVVAEVLAGDPDSVPDEPGVHRGIRRTGRFRALRLPVHDRFTPTLERPAPAAYLLPAADTAAARRLRLHGVRVEPLRAAAELRAEAFTVDSVARAERPFQGHREVRLEGRWRPVRRAVPAGALLVRLDQPLATLAVYLLEPESDDGLATWGTFDAALAAGAEFPVLRLLETPR